MQKLVAFDMALAIETYNAASINVLARHQAAIRELSTPVFSESVLRPFGFFAASSNRLVVRMRVALSFSATEGPMPSISVIG